MVRSRLSQFYKMKQAESCLPAPAKQHSGTSFASSSGNT